MRHILTLLFFIPMLASAQPDSTTPKVRLNDYMPYFAQSKLAYTKASPVNYRWFMAYRWYWSDSLSRWACDSFLRQELINLIPGNGLESSGAFPNVTLSLRQFFMDSLLGLKQNAISNGPATTWFKYDKTWSPIGIGDIANLQDRLDNKENRSQKNVANGYAGLNGLGQLSVSVLPVLSSATQPPYTLAAAFPSVATATVPVTGWSVPVIAGKKYKIEIFGEYQTAVNTTGGTLGIALVGAVGTVRGKLDGHITQAAAATPLQITLRATSGAGSFLTTTGTSGANLPHYIGGWLEFTCTVSGTLNIVWGTEVAASSAQLNAGSEMIVTQLN